MSLFDKVLKESDIVKLQLAYERYNLGQKYVKKQFKQAGISEQQLAELKAGYDLFHHFITKLTTSQDNDEVGFFQIVDENPDILPHLFRPCEQIYLPHPYQSACKM